MEDHALSVDAELARLEAQQMFQKMLTGWAWDVLQLRRAGLDVPTHRQPHEDEDYSWRQAA
jgi:hypothetical protein